MSKSHPKDRAADNNSTEGTNMGRRSSLGKETLTQKQELGRKENNSGKGERREGTGRDIVPTTRHHYHLTGSETHSRNRKSHLAFPTLLDHSCCRGSGASDCDSVCLLVWLFVLFHHPVLFDRSIARVLPLQIPFEPYPHPSNRFAPFLRISKLRFGGFSPSLCLCLWDWLSRSDLLMVFCAILFTWRGHVDIGPFTWCFHFGAINSSNIVTISYRPRHHRILSSAPWPPL